MTAPIMHNGGLAWCPCAALNELEIVARGRHSGIPECCVAFFAHEWLPRFDSDWEGDHRWLTVYRRCIPRHAHYIPCQKCITARSFVRVHECGPQREGQPGSCYELPAWQQAVRESVSAFFSTIVAGLPLIADALRFREESTLTNHAPATYGGRRDATRPVAAATGTPAPGAVHLRSGASGAHPRRDPQGVRDRHRR